MSDKVISVAVPRPVSGLFTYRIPESLESLVQVGGWVKVPFGRAVTHAFVVESPRAFQEADGGLQLQNLKDVIEVPQPEVKINGDVWKLCKWAHEYYLAPLGEILNCALPAAVIAGKVSSRPKKEKASSGVLDPPREVHLTSDQFNAVELLEGLRQTEDSKVALLRGVTGSGKTEVYIEIAKKALAEGKGVLILVPEIALTPQLYQRFEKGLGVPVALWHSALSDGKRRSYFKAVSEGKVRVVVGARSAVFAPLHNLGLIVVDEEHDPTYKQEDRVRYHARDLAVVRGKLTRSLVVLGSATPSLETLERVREGRYTMAELPTRYASSGLPTITFSDLKEEELVPHIQAPLAITTLNRIKETLSAGEQVMVYLNRRGFASFLLCRECGEVSGCPKCSISLTLHKRQQHLRCHTCGHREEIPSFCKKCQGTDLFPMGAGTESLEADLSTLVPEAKIARLDRDQITSATRLGQVLEAFRRGESNLLVGTQMLVKGHDFPGVTLVVVVLADSLFRWPDFRAPERGLQILKQVSGRAGRGAKPGRVLVQTFDPDHSVLQVLDGRLSEESFLESERQLRQALGYPPFGRMARLRFESPSKAEAQQRALSVSEQLSVRFSAQIHPSDPKDRVLELLGPSEAFLEKVKNTYRWDLLLKSKNIQTLQRAVGLSREICAERKWQFLTDIDPYGI